MAAWPQARAGLAALGALAGLALWFLGDRFFASGAPPRPALLVAAFAAGAAGSFLLLAGPLGPRRAALTAAALGAGGALLLTLGSLRFETVAAYLDTGHPISAWILLMAGSLPFLLAGRAWRDHDGLIEAAWTLGFRGAAAGAFTLVTWLLVLLSDGLLTLVGIEVVGDLAERPPVAAALTGGALGLALAVTDELGRVPALGLPLRLLRLAAPPALLVSLVFLVMLPVRGLDGLFGDLTPAGTLMGMGFAAMVLLAACLAESGGEGAPRLMRGIARGLAVVLPLLAALAVLSIGVRVRQYGWTPDRVVAAVLAGYLVAAGLVQALAALGPGDWSGRVRRQAGPVRLAALVVAAAFFTPLLDPQAIAARSQLQRLARGDVAPEALDLYALAQEWGRAGTRALGRLEATRPELADRIAAARIAPGPRMPGGAEDAEARAQLAAVLPLAGGAALAPERLRGLDGWLAREALAGCARATGEGRPGCIAVEADLLPETPGPELALVWLEPAGESRALVLRDGEPGEAVAEIRLHGGLDRLPPGTVDAIAASAFAVVPVPLQALEVGGIRIVPVP